MGARARTEATDDCGGRHWLVRRARVTGATATSAYALPPLTCKVSEAVPPAVLFA
jgi:hypothetical protein